MKEYLLALTTYNDDALNFLEFSFSLKLLFIVLLIGVIIYIVLMSFRVKILTDTVKTPFNKYVNLATMVSIVSAVLLSVLSIMLILIG